MQLQVINSPFSQEQTENLNRLLPTLTEAQRLWLSGYLAVPQASAAETASAAAVEQDAPKAGVSTQERPSAVVRGVTILYGTETGNAQSIAEDMFEKLKGQDFTAKISALDDFKPRDLKKVEDLLIVTATHGEGDPPDNAISFYEVLHSRKAPKLEDVRFSVLALGDESYEFFCQTGKDFDKRLEELGGNRIYPLVNCDVDFDEDAAAWVAGVFETLTESQKALSANEPAGDEGNLDEQKQPVYSRKNPFRAEVLESLNLNAEGSNKETRHLELSIEESNLDFKPGDSLGIFPENDPELVDRLIEELGWDPEVSVEINKQGDLRSLRNALLTNFEITRLTKSLVEKAAKIFSNEALNEFMKQEREKERKLYLEGRDLLDFVRDFPPNKIEAEEFIHILRKMPARLYSIANSYKANPDEVHLTIGTVRYNAYGRDRTGVCSGQCAERVKPGDLLPIYIQHNQNFNFPSNAETPVIMIGPGTGVAPYRSFLEEREVAEVNGKTWLFFGDQHFATDFLYQVEWQNWLQKGVLTRMDVAFSRDTEKKIYVQDRMLENSQELYQWITEGGHVYVCGDEKKMAKDVHQTLLTILEKEGQMSSEDAEGYINTMRQQRRYQRDVY